MPDALPLFPLNTVLVPGLVLPLHIFEPRYRRLVEDLLARLDPADREFGIVAIRDGRSVEADGIDALFPVGIATVLRDADRLPDGRFDIVTVGSRRFTLRSIDASEPLIRAEVEFLDDPDTDVDPMLIADVTRRLGAYRALLGLEDEDDDLPDDPTVLSYLVTASLVIPSAERQRLLASSDAAARLTLARTVLVREIGLIRALASVPAVDLSPASSSPN